MRGDKERTRQNRGMRGVEEESRGDNTKQDKRRREEKEMEEDYGEQERKMRSSWIKNIYVKTRNPAGAEGNTTQTGQRASQHHPP